MSFLKNLFSKAQAEIKVITNKDIKNLKTKYVYIKRKNKLIKFKVMTNSLGIANLLEVKK